MSEVSATQNNDPTFWRGQYLVQHKAAEHWRIECLKAQRDRDMFQTLHKGAQIEFDRLELLSRRAAYQEGIADARAEDNIYWSERIVSLLEALRAINEYPGHLTETKASGTAFAAVKKIASDALVNDRELKERMIALAQAVQEAVADREAAALACRTPDRQRHAYAYVKEGSDEMRCTDCGADSDDQDKPCPGRTPEKQNDQPF